MGRRLLVLLLLALLGLSFLTVVVRADDGDDDADAADGAAHGQHEGAGGHGAGAEADDDDDEKPESEEEEKEVELQPSQHVATAIIFPDFVDKKFTLSDKVTLLISIKNSGDAALNITGVQARLHSPFDYKYIIQNFTYREVGMAVDSKKEGSLDYVFHPDKGLEPIEYHLSAYVDYNDSANLEYRSFVFNGTIELIEKASTFDAKYFFSYFMLFGGVALVGYILWSVSKPVSKPSRHSSAVEQGTRVNSATTQKEWAGEIYTPKSQSQAVNKKRSKSKKSEGKS